MTGGRWFLKLYPREWRERYGDELAALIGDRRLSLADSIDLIAGAIDARFANKANEAKEANGAIMPSILRTACQTRNDPQTIADGLRAAAVMVVASLAIVGLGAIAERLGWPQTARGIKDVSFPVSLALMSHFLYLRKQSPTAKWIITGGTLTILTILAVVATK